MKKSIFLVAMMAAFSCYAQQQGKAFRATWLSSNMRNVPRQDTMVIILTDSVITIGKYYRLAVDGKPKRLKKREAIFFLEDDWQLLIDKYRGARTVTLQRIGEQGANLYVQREVFIDVSKK